MGRGSEYAVLRELISRAKASGDEGAAAREALRRLETVLNLWAGQTDDEEILKGIAEAKILASIAEDYTGNVSSIPDTSYITEMVIHREEEAQKLRSQLRGNTADSKKAGDLDDEAMWALDQAAWAGTLSSDAVDAACDDVAAEIADRLHEQWRDDYIAANGDKPRWKPVGSSKEIPSLQEQIAAGKARQLDDGSFEVDIASMSYTELPQKFQHENRLAGKAATEAAAQGLHYASLWDRRLSGGDIDALASHIHDRWVDRNKSWAPDNLKVPFNELPEEEKEKDRQQLRLALGSFRDRFSKSAGAAV